MITKTGYSKDPSMVPEGIIITFGREMVADNGGLKTFIQHFNDVINHPDNWWLHKLSNPPTVEVADVYIIIANRLYGRVKYGWIESGKTLCYDHNYKPREIEWRRLILVGPLERCPVKRVLKGFQGFRYCTTLW